ncbi:hypothetical protein PPERSA_04457 [Pseudocohnilembus persalinus]|uniref:Uncharacterized protein n=1 Tax=Pseudocohnilembus persalinus TaxID=266149 RepID=A0A0V0QQR3_PSEPJ|nr:hypothetical protein PPERSA_04457 [Pseudocohnilembus persalinus]|eukprot:KRX04642.1 hypothetical protein PPERSA_04457 [Pseudocohnilembus persalinus]
MQYKHIKIKLLQNISKFIDQLYKIELIKTQKFKIIFFSQIFIQYLPPISNLASHSIQHIPNYHLFSNNFYFLNFSENTIQIYLFPHLIQKNLQKIIINVSKIQTEVAIQQLQHPYNLCLEFLLQFPQNPLLNPFRD